MIDLSIVIVSWNVRHFLQRCLHSIYFPATSDKDEGRLEETVTREVIVVDNASADGSPQMVRDSFPEVKLVANRSNRGFPAANNQGIDVAGGRYVLLLNPDTQIIDDALGKLISFADQHPDIGMIGPQLLNPDGSVQSSRRRFPTLATAFIESTWLQPVVTDLHASDLVGFLGAPLARLLERYHLADCPDGLVQDVDWITGAAMLARRSAIDEVGPMDEGFFMYSEELDWCRRFSDAGWRVVYLPEAQVVHHVGKSSEQVLAARHIHFQTSKIRYFRKYHGRTAAEALRWYLLTSYSCQLCLEGLKWLVGHKRPVRAQRIRAYRRVVASKLRPARQD